MIQSSQFAKVSAPVPQEWPPFHMDANYTYVKPLPSTKETLAIAAKHSSGEICAIKCLSNVGFNIERSKTCLRELKVSSHLRSHKNILCVYDMDFELDNQQRLADVYIYTELPRSNLAHIIASKRSLSDQHIQFITYQLACAINYIHSAGIIHGNVQPSNILVNPDTTIRLSDFTHARTPDTSSVTAIPRASSEAILYQAPELLLGAAKTTYALDIWSIGCIFTILYNGSPIFDRKDLPGQIRTIIQHLGTPPDEVLMRIASQQTAKNLKDFRRQTAPSLRQVFPHANSLEMEVFEKTLKWDPLRRSSSLALLGSAYFSPWRSEVDEAVCNRALSSGFEQEYRQEAVNHMIMREVSEFRATVRQETLGGFRPSRQMLEHSVVEGFTDISDEDGEFEWDPNERTGTSYS